MTNGFVNINIQDGKLCQNVVVSMKLIHRRANNNHSQRPQKPQGKNLRKSSTREFVFFSIIHLTEVLACALLKQIIMCVEGINLWRPGQVWNSASTTLLEYPITFPFPRFNYTNDISIKFQQH